MSSPSRTGRPWRHLRRVLGLDEASCIDCIDGVEQLTRYLDLLNRDPLLTTQGPVRGIFAAQLIKPQARVLAEDRGIACALVDYDALRGMDHDAEHRLF